MQRSDNRLALSARTTTSGLRHEAISPRTARTPSTESPVTSIVPLSAPQPLTPPATPRASGVPARDARLPRPQEHDLALGLPCDARVRDAPWPRAGDDVRVPSLQAIGLAAPRRRDALHEVLGDVDWRDAAALTAELPRLEAKATLARALPGPLGVSARSAFFTARGHVFPSTPTLGQLIPPTTPILNGPVDGRRIAERVVQGRAPEETWLVGVVGAPGTGKSTLARSLAEGLNEDGLRCRVLELDGYLRPRAERQNLVGLDIFDRAAWARDLAQIRQHPDRPLALRRFDHSTGQVVEADPLVPREADVLIVEGALCRPEECDFSLGVYADDVARLENMLDRSPQHAERLRTIFWQHQLSLVPEHTHPALATANLVVANDFSSARLAPSVQSR